MILVNGQSGIRFIKDGIPVLYKGDKDFEKLYFTNDRKIYSDKIAKFVCKSNELSNNAVINRLCKIYTHVFIDEFQDLAGLDLDILKLLFNSRMNILLVGDPRQGTYSTHNSKKHKKYKKSEIMDFFEDNKKKNLEIDEQTLTINYRCVQAICELSNTLFPELLETKYGNNINSDHDGVFLVRPNDVSDYLKKYTPILLRDSRRTRVPESFEVMNFGEAKGLAFERVLIYPTDPIRKWLKNRNSELPSTSRSRLYVGITRARQSVAFIYDYSEDENIEGINKYK